MKSVFALTQIGCLLEKNDDRMLTTYANKLVSTAAKPEIVFTDQHRRVGLYGYET